jgi:hypothetical protein
MAPSARYECSNCVERTEAKSLSDKYSTTIGLPVENEKRPEIKAVLFGDKFQHLVPTVESDHHRNYKKPDPEDYRKKRTVVWVPKHDESAISKNATSEYVDEYIPREIKREKLVIRK